ncbi:hypothetical protein PTT_16314 [Pyrenophora teres f. teres 0-1]|uniref:Uncharacterized protein n=2 Tax=Pyrenophora teres f. teres TaxID=97479 RepID=E3S208_PYRTT|nr:hypothetical protein PTT_16314 [Pyrenophora teres f. teres 0-1]CAE7206352.1 hypothetical protein PTTW11_09538 [Pyrenophora teres f. teres]
MATSTMTMVSPIQPVPLTRIPSAFKDPRPPPSTPSKTAQLWDEYERQAVEKAREREMHTQTSQVLLPTVPKTRKARPQLDRSTSRSSFDFRFRRAHAATPSTTVSICKTCQHPIIYASGICELCIRTIVLPAPGEATPPISPATRNFPTSDPQPFHTISSGEEAIVPIPISPRRASFCPLPPHMAELPMRMSSLQPPSEQQEADLDTSRQRKTSLTDPNLPILRLQIAHVPRSLPDSHPTTPTSPPWTQSRSSTRRSSLANVALLPTQPWPHARNDSVTLSEMSTLYPSASAGASSPPTSCRVGYPLQTTVSAWDDWDSDDDKVGLAGWMGRRKAKSRGMDSFDSERERPRTGVSERPRKARMSKEEIKLERARIEAAETARAFRLASEKMPRKKQSGFAKMFTCGCGDD